MIPHTVTQRGTPGGESRSGAAPVSLPLLGSRGASAMLFLGGVVAVTPRSSRQYVSIKTYCLDSVVVYSFGVPKLWTETIEAHRREVREAILETTWALVTERGLLSVTMSQIAEAVGIGRATLYKYFPDVEAILHAWHQRHVADHLDQLTALRDQPGDPVQRLEAMLQAYALICHHRGRHGTELVALLHHGDHVDRAQQHLHDMIRDLLAEVAKAGELRDDVAPDELASFCLHALTAASSLPSESAAHRLVTVVLAGLRRTR